MTDSIYLPSPARDHFHANLDRVTDECMIWPHRRDSYGYGTVVLDGRLVMVHAAACEARHGPRPEGMIAAHGPCHNPACWNGAHVSWETRAQNQADRLRDGTHQLGEANASAVLTTEVVTQLRAAYANGGTTQRALAERFGITQPAVSKIVNRKSWSHLV